MLRKQIENQELNLEKYKSLLNGELEDLERFIKGLSIAPVSMDSDPAQTLSTQVDNITSTILSIGKVISRYEMEVNKHQDIINSLKEVNKELIDSLVVS